MKYTYYQLGIMAAVVSFLGFVVENIWLAMTKGYINNRNMNAPFLLGYGLLILFMYTVFGTPAAFKMFTKEKVRWKRYLLYFLCSFAVVCVGALRWRHFVILNTGIIPIFRCTLQNIRPYRPVRHLRQ